MNLCESEVLHAVSLHEHVKVVGLPLLDDPLNFSSCRCGDVFRDADIDLPGHGRAVLESRGFPYAKQR